MPKLGRDTTTIFGERSGVQSLERNCDEWSWRGRGNRAPTGGRPFFNYNMWPAGTYRYFRVYYERFSEGFEAFEEAAQARTNLKNLRKADTRRGVTRGQIV